MQRIFWLLFFFTIRRLLMAQLVVNEFPVNQSFWAPDELGAHYFIPDSSYFSIHKGCIEIESRSFDKFELFSIINQKAKQFRANGFFQDSVVFDSTLSIWQLKIRFFALNRFDIDKLPVVPPGLYLLNPFATNNGRVRIGQATLKTDLPGSSTLDLPYRNFVIAPDTFFFVPGVPDLVVYLDGPMGAKYRWKKRKLEADFVFSVKGAIDAFSYKTDYSKKNSIYVSLRPSLAHWFLAGYGFDWWSEGPL